VTKVVGVVPSIGDLPGERVVLNHDTACFDEQGVQLSFVEQVVKAVLSDRRLAEKFALEGTEDHKFFAVESSPARFPSGERVFLQKLEPLRLRSLDTLEISGSCRIARCQFNMTYGHLGPVQVAWGSGLLDGRDAMVLAVKAEGTVPTLTLHLNKQGGRK
jgi:hypothetical protein